MSKASKAVDKLQEKHTPPWRQPVSNALLTTIGEGENTVNIKAGRSAKVILLSTGDDNPVVLSKFYTKKLKEVLEAALKEME